MEIGRRGLAIIFLISFLGGLEYFIGWVKIVGDKNNPIVTGKILARTPCKNFGVPSTDFSIKVENTPVEVHAITGKNLINKIPEIVHFRYSGDSTKKVFLFEYEEDPLWIWPFCWAVAALFFLLFFNSRKKEGK